MIRWLLKRILPGPGRVDDFARSYWSWYWRVTEPPTRKVEFGRRVTREELDREMDLAMERIHREMMDRDHRRVWTEMIPQEEKTEKGA